MKETEKNPNKNTGKWNARPESEKAKKQAAEARSLEDWEGGGSRPQQENQEGDNANFPNRGKKKIPSFVNPRSADREKAA